MYIDQIKSLLKLEKVQEYIKNAYSIDNKDYPFNTYVGINFNDTELINVKLYFSFFKKLNEDEVHKVLPIVNKDHFYNYYNQWIETKNYDTIHRGATFAIKVDKNKNTTNYFGIRIKDTTFDFPKLVHLSEEDSKRYRGICQEISDNKSYEKNYYFIYDKPTIKSILEKYNENIISEHIDKIWGIEYVESEKRVKFTTGILDTGVLNQYISKYKNQEMSETIFYIQDKLQLQVYGPGISDDLKTRAIYFVEPSAFTKFEANDVVKKFLSL